MLVIDEQQSEVVRYIFEQYSIGVYVKHILLELDRRGVTYHGTKRITAETDSMCSLAPRTLTRCARNFQPSS